jgi:hypothetical protein
MIIGNLKETTVVHRYGTAAVGQRLQRTERQRQVAYIMVARFTSYNKCSMPCLGLESYGVS